VKTIRSPAQTGQESERFFFETPLVIYGPTARQIYGRDVANPEHPANPNTDPFKLINWDWICKEHPTCASCSCCEFGVAPMLNWSLRFSTHLEPIRKGI